MPGPWLQPIPSISPMGTVSCGRLGWSLSLFLQRQETDDQAVELLALFVFDEVTNTAAPHVNAHVRDGRERGERAFPRHHPIMVTVDGQHRGLEPIDDRGQIAV